MEQSIPSPENPEKKIKKRGVVRDFLEAFVIALIIALPIKYFIASPFIVVQSSMHPTFEGGDYLIVDKLVYRFGDPRRGDVVVFKPPFSTGEYFIKRVVGLPGDTLTIKSNVVTIKNNEHPEGYVLPEPYVSSFRAGDTDVTLGTDEYFVMGDNRAVSSDSRAWGPLNKTNISGRADIRLFPFGKIDIMPGAAQY